MPFYQSSNSSIPYNYDSRIYDNFSFVEHLHRDFELVYVTEGEILLTLEGRTQSLSEGDFAMILPDQIHSYRTETASRTNIIVFSKEYVPEFCAALGKTTCEDNVFQVGEVDRSFLAAKLSQPSMDRIECSAVLNFAAAAFLKHAVLIPKDKKRGNMLAHRMLEYISEHYREEITLESMARSLGYEVHYISARFHEFFEKNFKRIVNEYRISHAKQLILSRGQQMTMTEIAFASGFRSVRNFNRAYKMIENVVPRQHLR